MMKRILSFLLFTFICNSYAFSQDKNGQIQGKIIDKVSREPLIDASIVIMSDSSKYTLSDIDGNFLFENLEAGYYDLGISFIGYQPVVLSDIQVTYARPAILTIELKEDSTMSAVDFIASPFEKSDESPVSVRSMDSDEIKRAPGGNRDISKVIRALPGVASSVSFRNDIIIRGGAPNENRFYLDGIEVPNINHFATQGSSGGPVGMINVDFIDNVDLYTGAFGANRGNALSSVMEFRQKEGRTDKKSLNAIVGASDIGITFQGPLSEKSSFIASARRSYLQFLFTALELPFLPTYNDFQFKYTNKINKNNKLTVLGLGAIDQFALNLSANETPSQRYLLNNLPVNEQWNYTVGSRWDHYHKDGFMTFVLSRSHLNNTTTKYFDNDESSDANLLLDYKSQEIEHKFRFEDFREYGPISITYGAGSELATYTVDTYNKVVVNGQTTEVDFNSDLNMLKGSLFGQLNYRIIEDKLTASFGVRTDFNNYAAQMSNPLDQLSPRLSLSWQVNKKLSVNGNTGIFYQLPAYTALGFRNNNGELANQANLKYIQCKHAVTGIEYLLNESTRMTVEGFYKRYNNYPFIISEGISLANLGADFGVIGNTELNSSSQGRSYGVEFMAQKKLSKGFYGILSYTLVRSEFTDDNNVFIPSAWDFQQLVSLTAAKRFGKNWEIGGRWLFTGPSPYTPYNINLSLQKDVWDITGQGILDYSQLNSQRLRSYHQLDIRIDKKYYFKKWSLNLYFDVQNIYGNTVQGQDFITAASDDNGNLITDPDNPNQYQYQGLENVSGTVLPTLGVIIEL